MAPILDLNKKVLVIYMVNFSLKMSILLAYKAQIGVLVAEKVFFLAKYLDYLDIFSKKSEIELLKCFDINEHLIHLK